MESNNIPQCEKIEYVEAKCRPVLGKFTEWAYHFPCVVKNSKDAWGVEKVIDLERLMKDFGDLECVMVDLSKSPEEVERQREQEVHLVKEYFELKKTHSLLYMTEVYMRSICSTVEERPYPHGIFGENWFHTDRPGRLESFFLGNKGTFGVIHDDRIFGLGFLYVISGLKRVMFFPPEAELLLRETFKPSFRLKHFPLDLDPTDVQDILKCRGRVAYVGPGELLVIPQGWWHQITNLEDETFSYVDMVLGKEHLLNYCSTTEPEKFSLQHCLREIIPYRLHLTALMKDRLLERSKQPEKKSNKGEEEGKSEEQLQAREEEQQKEREKLTKSKEEKEIEDCREGGTYGKGRRDAHDKEWEQFYGLTELSRGVRQLLKNLTNEDEKIEFAGFLENINLAAQDLFQCLMSL